MRSCPVLRAAWYDRTVRHPVYIKFRASLRLSASKVGSADRHAIS